MQTTWKTSLATLMAIGAAACSDSSPILEPDDIPPPDLSEVSGAGKAGALYVSTNATAGNEVLVFPVPVTAPWERHAPTPPAGWEPGGDSAIRAPWS